MFNYFTTFIEFTKLLIFFRQELWNINDLDNYFIDTNNVDSFQKKVISYGIICIKICQWISQRVDILGKNTIKTLEFFQKSVPAHSNLFDKDSPLKLGLNTKFSYIDNVCIGSGSISQVHKCISIDNIHGVIKITHPNVKENIDKNIDWFTAIVPIINIVYPPTNILNLNQMISTIKIQIDYSFEVKNQILLKQILSKLEFVIVPEVYDYTHNYIFQEMCCGLSRQEIEESYPEYLIDMAQKTQAAYFWMTYCGYIHTDLHDGNVFYHIDSEDDSKNKIIIVDFGLVFELDEKKESSLHIKNFRYMSQKNNEGLQLMIKESLDKFLYSEKELQKIYSRINSLNLVDKDLKNMNMVEYADDILNKLNETNAILRTPELYCFLGLILVCREFRDNDGKPFDVLISSMNLLLNSKDEEVAKYAKEVNSYISNIW